MRPITATGTCLVLLAYATFISWRRRSQTLDKETFDLMELLSGDAWVWLIQRWISSDWQPVSGLRGKLPICNSCEALLAAYDAKHKAPPLSWTWATLLATICAYAKPLLAVVRFGEHYTTDCRWLELQSRRPKTFISPLGIPTRPSDGMGLKLLLLFTSRSPLEWLNPNCKKKLSDTHGD